MVTCPEVSAWCGLCLTLLCVFHGHVLLLCVCAFDRHLENAAMSFVPRAALKIPSKKNPKAKRSLCATTARTLKQGTQARSGAVM